MICHLINENPLRNIPEELKSLPQWVGFLMTSGTNGRMSKKPVNPHTLYGASSVNPETWGSLEDALNAVGKPCKVGSDSGSVEGVGFVLAPPYCGIDLDHVIDKETGEVHPDALDVVETMDSYTEVSPSGTGLHIFYKGKVHADWKKKQGDAFGENTDLEMYQTGRYFTVTGNVFRGCTEVNERDNMAELIQKTYMKQEQKRPDTKTESKVRSISKTDSELLSMAMNSKSGMLFSELYSGRWEGKYASQSDADMAFCSMLAFWFGRDIDRMDSVYRRSGLMRGKWDSKRSGSTYGRLTLQKAIDTCKEVYSPENRADSDFGITIKQKQSKTYSTDDTGNAQRFSDMYGDRIRYNFNDKKWMIYYQNKWSYDMTLILWKLIDKSVESMVTERKLYEEYDKQHDTETLKEFDKHIKRSRSNNSKKALEKEVQHYHTVTPNNLDRHKRLLNTPGGVIDLTSFETKPCSPDYYFTKSTSVSLSENAQCPLWLRFLDDIFNGNKELIDYIQKACGYSLSGMTDEQCAFFCYGTGRNGKTTFLDIIRCIAGDYASNIQPETLMIKGNANNGANSDIARLKGARFVTSVEPNEGLRLNEGLIKQLTGDDVVTARKLYGEEFEFKPEFKLWMATNHKPVIRGTDTGIWRRIHLIPFTVQIPENKIDRKLKDKLMNEAEGIFRWCLEGLKKYNSEGLKKPEAVIRATSEYRHEMDVVSRFLEEATEECFAGTVKACDLYRNYTNWCRENGELQLSNTKFGKELCQRFERMKRPDGLYYCGLKFVKEYNGE